MAHKARKFFRPFFCHFYSRPPFFNLATLMAMAHKARKIFRTFFCHFYSWPPFSTWLPISTWSPRVPWRIKRENLFGPFLPMWSLSALYTLFDKENKVKTTFPLQRGITCPSVGNVQTQVCVRCRPRSIACCLCTS